jgi:hypothetical protein
MKRNTTWLYVVLVVLIIVAVFVYAKYWPGRGSGSGQVQGALDEIKQQTPEDIPGPELEPGGAVPGSAGPRPMTHGR